MFFNGAVIEQNPKEFTWEISLILLLNRKKSITVVFHPESILKKHDKNILVEIKTSALSP